MARAAAGLADVVREVLARRGRGADVVLLVGSGNNGGDALFAGAALAVSGCRVSVVEVGSRTHEAGLRAALDAGAVRVAPDEAPAVAGAADVIIDGILGTGAVASPALRGPARETVAAILTELGGAEAPAVVAVDIPSGIDPDDGSVPDANVLPADVTVTFGGIKAGLLQGPAVGLAGEVRLVEIGIEADLAGLTPAVVAP